MGFADLDRELKKLIDDYDYVTVAKALDRLRLTIVTPTKSIQRVIQVRSLLMKGVGINEISARIGLSVAQTKYYAKLWIPGKWNRDKWEKGQGYDLIEWEMKEIKEEADSRKMTVDQLIELWSDV